MEGLANSKMTWKVTSGNLPWWLVPNSITCDCRDEQSEQGSPDLLPPTTVGLAHIVPTFLYFKLMRPTLFADTPSIYGHYWSL